MALDLEMLMQGGAGLNTHTHTHTFELCMFLSEGERQKFSKTIGPLLKKMKRERERSCEGTIETNA